MVSFYVAKIILFFDIYKFVNENLIHYRQTLISVCLYSRHISYFGSSHPKVNRKKGGMREHYLYGYVKIRPFLLFMFLFFVFIRFF